MMHQTMTQYWQKISIRVDALSAREQSIVFALSALVLVMLINTLFIDPQEALQKKLKDRMQQEQALTAAMLAEIQLKSHPQSVVAQTPEQIRLRELNQRITQMQVAMQDVQKGLVSPDKMSSLLESIVKQNGKLKLLSLKTLPVAELGGKPPQSDGPPPKKAGSTVSAALAKPSDATGRAVFRHGIEITVHGQYLDLMAYLSRLESVPWHVFWGRAEFRVDEYPDNTLTLTLYTLSLDEAWLNL